MNEGRVNIICNILHMYASYVYFICTLETETKNILSREKKQSNIWCGTKRMVASGQAHRNKCREHEENRG